MEFGITIFIMKSRKRETADGIKKHHYAWREGKLQVIGIIESRHHQTS